MKGLVRYQRPGFFVPEVEDFFRNVSDAFTTVRKEYPVEIFEEGEELVVSIDAPGIAPEKVEIRAFSDRVVVRGADEQEEECKEDRRYHCRKRRVSVDYSISLPVEVVPDDVKASVKNGVISVRLPKKGKDEGRLVNLIQE